MSMDNWENDCECCGLECLECLDLNADGVCESCSEEEIDMNMLALFKAGDRVYGYCNGYFGRDDYDDKICIMVRPKYALFENDDGVGTVLHCDEGIDEDTIAKWKVYDEEDNY